MTSRAVIVSIAIRNLITGSNGMIQLEATKVNDHFCVVRYPAGCWSVTHIQTGWRACQARTEKKAFAAADALARINGVDWATLTPESAKAIADPERMKVRAVVERFGFPGKDGAPS